jgi:hypothetical protein
MDIISNLVDDTKVKIYRGVDCYNLRLIIQVEGDVTKARWQAIIIIKVNRWNNNIFYEGYRCWTRNKYESYFEYPSTTQSSEGNIPYQTTPGYRNYDIVQKKYSNFTFPVITEEYPPKRSGRKKKFSGTLILGNHGEMAKTERFWLEQIIKCNDTDFGERIPYKIESNDEYKGEWITLLNKFYVPMKVQNP